MSVGRYVLQVSQFPAERFLAQPLVLGFIQLKGLAPFVQAIGKVDKHVAGAIGLHEYPVRAARHLA
ncbi:hypothetical protein D3C77_809740 [compost metagenome]